MRAAVPEDVDAVADVHVRSWQWAYAGLLPDDLLAGLRAEDRVPQWQRRVESADPGRALLLADVAGAVVGFVAVGAGREQVGGPEVGELDGHLRRARGGRHWRPVGSCTMPASPG